VAHVSLITLGVNDLADATRFYEAMGWRRSSASVNHTVAFLRGGSVVLGLSAEKTWQPTPESHQVRVVVRGLPSP
jgi:catechol 2,3-dioxygenase-like lactoylglutathione lyase family enzyme